MAGGQYRRSDQRSYQRSINVEQEAVIENFNQSPPLEGVDLFNADKILQNLTSSIQSEYANECLTGYGKLAGGDLLDAGFNANENPPQ